MHIYVHIKTTNEMNAYYYYIHIYRKKYKSTSRDIKYKWKKSTYIEISEEKSKYSKINVQIYPCILRHI